MSYRFFLLMRKEFLQFFRNVPLLIIVLYMSTIDVYSAGAMSMDIRNFPMGIYDLDRTEQSRNIIEKLREPYFKIAHYLNQESEITDLIQRGKFSGVLVIKIGTKRSRNREFSPEQREFLRALHVSPEVFTQPRAG